MDYPVMHPYSLEYKQNIITLYKKVFKDDDSFIIPYFNIMYEEKNTLIININNQIIASLQMIPCLFKDYKGIMHKVIYIFSVMTDPEFRHKGMMNKLLNEAIKESKINNADFMILIPQEEYLFKIYSKYGFCPAFYSCLSKTELKIQEGNFKLYNNDNLLYNFYITNIQNNNFAISKNQFITICKNLKGENNSIITVGEKNEIKGIALTSKQNKKLIALYIYSKNNIWLKILYSEISKQTNENNIYKNSPSIYGNPYGMYLQLNNKINIKNLDLASLQLMMDI